MHIIQYQYPKNENSQLTTHIKFSVDGFDADTMKCFHRICMAPWAATTAAWPVPAPVARGPTRTAELPLLALGRYRTQKIMVME